MSSVINIVQWETLKCCRAGIKCLLQFLLLNGRFKVTGLYSFSQSYWVSLPRMLSDWRMFRIKELLFKAPNEAPDSTLTPGGHLRWAACPAVKWALYTTDGHQRHVCKPAALGMQRGINSCTKAECGTLHNRHRSWAAGPANPHVATAYICRHVTFAQQQTRNLQPPSTRAEHP